MEGKKRKLKWKQVLTPETLELLSGIGTKPLKIIAATVYEWERETDRDNEVRRQKMKGGGWWWSWTLQGALRDPCRQT